MDSLIEQLEKMRESLNKAISEQPQEMQDALKEKQDELNKIINVGITDIRK